MSDDLETRLRAFTAGDVEAASAAAARRLSEHAAAEGLAEVAYATVDAPVGTLVVASTNRGLVRVSFGDEPVELVVEDLSARLSPRVVEAPGRLDEVRRELDEYFAGHRQHFDLEVDLALTRTDFSRRVLAAISRVPYGRTVTYGQVAGQAGNARAYRAAGNALGANPVPIVVPCHRVVHAGGGLGGYGGGLDRKRLLLSLEGALGAG